MYLTKGLLNRKLYNILFEIFIQNCDFIFTIKLCTYELVIILR